MPVIPQLPVLQLNLQWNYQGELENDSENEDNRS